MSELKERLDNLRALMPEPMEFLEGKGLNNEVNILMFIANLVLLQRMQIQTLIYWQYCRVNI